MFQSAEPHSNIQEIFSKTNEKMSIEFIKFYLKQIDNKKFANNSKSISKAVLVLKVC